MNHETSCKTSCIGVAETVELLRSILADFVSIRPASKVERVSFGSRLVTADITSYNVYCLGDM